MAKHGKKYLKVREIVDQQLQNKQLSASVSDVLGEVKKLAFAKFDETVDVHIRLGIDPTKADQSVRGSLVLPNNPRRVARVIVFAKGDFAEQAVRAGADLVGADDLIEKIAAGWMDFDYAVSTPDMMGQVGRLAKLLGPRGLLPNKKLGTVTFEVADIVTDLKKGRVFFKSDKAGLVNFSVGKVSQSVEALTDNLKTFMKALAAAKPASSKGVFMRKIIISSTMGVGMPLDPQSVLRV